MRFGTGELIVVGFVILVVFSASRMGKLGDALGRFVFSFKKASRGNDLVDVTPTRARRGKIEPEDADIVDPGKGGPRRS